MKRIRLFTTQASKVTEPVTTPTLAPGKATTIRRPTLRDTRTSRLRNFEQNELGEIQVVRHRHDFLYGTGKYDPVAAFENSLKIGTGLDIYEIYQNVRQAGVGALQKISIDDYKRVLARIARFHFQVLGGRKTTEFAIQLRKDFIESGRTPDIDFDALVIQSFVFMPFARMPELSKVLGEILESKKDASGFDLSPVYNAFLNVLLAIDCFDVAHQLIAQVKKDRSKTKIDVNPLYLSLCQAYAAKGDMVNAEKVYAEAKEAGVVEVPEYSCALLKGYASLGNLPMTRKYFNLVPGDSKPVYNSIKYHFLIHCHSVRKMPAEAEKVYQEMRTRGIEAKPSAYEHLILANIDNRTAATQWFYKVEKPSMNMYGALISVIIKSGDSLVAWRTLNNAIKTFRESKSKSSRFHLPQTIAEPLVQDLVGKPVEQLRELMKFAPIAPSVRSELLARFMLTAVTEKVSNPDLALTFYNEFTTQGGCGVGCEVPFKVHFYALKAYCLKGDLQTARALFNQVIDQSFGLELETYDILLKGYADIKDKDGLFELYEDLKKQNLKPTVNSYEALLTLASDEQKHDLAKEIRDAGFIVNRQKLPLVFEALGADLLPQGLLRA